MKTYKPANGTDFKAARGRDSERRMLSTRRYPISNTEVIQSVIELRTKIIEINTKEYERYGDEWEKEMMKMSKKELVGLLRKAWMNDEH